ncbi:MAG: hypothetical protein AAF561_01045 [Planctomycetota bacterium]
MSTAFNQDRTISARIAAAANMALLVRNPVYGLSESLMTDVQNANDALQAAATLAAQPTTRTKSNIADRNQKLDDFSKISGRVVSILRGNADLTDKQLEDIGVRPLATKRKSIPAPSEAPVFTNLRVDGRTIYGELRREARGRGKPADVTGAILFTATGPIAPMGMDGWTFAQSTTKTKFTLTMPPSETETVVWISAFWQNAKDESGPASEPVSVKLASGGALPTENEERSPMRIAA